MRLSGAQDQTAHWASLVSGWTICIGLYVLNECRCVYSSVFYFYRYGKGLQGSEALSAEEAEDNLAKAQAQIDSLCAHLSNMNALDRLGSHLWIEQLTRLAQHPDSAIQHKALQARALAPPSLLILQGITLLPF